MSKKDLTTETSKNVAAFLEQVSKTPVLVAGKDRGRLIFAMDATASRQYSWDQAMHIQADMFQETRKLGGLDIQLCYFRGFEEFKATPWTSKSEQLLKLMTGVSCLAGETQIAKVLQHGINQAKAGRVNALVFVGDCCEEHIDRLGRLAGELSILGVPCFLFHEGDDPNAARVFQQIATLTKGAYCRFDQASAQTLKDLLKAVAIFASGGKKALDSYVSVNGGASRLLIEQMRSS